MSKQVTITVDGDTWFTGQCDNLEQDCRVVADTEARVTFTATYPLAFDRIKGMTGTVIDGLIRSEPSTTVEPLPPFAGGALGDSAAD